ncbi:hypothetical protein [Bradyrhizobium sp. JYMT SZCCT0428]|uniref:hypothetical protein n=1 Tax=Bradyrhizobium sp. JYMT SZCCT0428 TaxID=2807673 RepID=UPI001BA47B0E|nr:hypothetical protein [Bradyrhizobium sp. JYMT SZCCT0428]MBR1154690.1 hypothetical protein [Bradyrhizobium sp. JYMT SZCCT0428]
MTTLKTAIKNNLLSDEALDAVAGGLNPQPLPPRWNSLSNFSHFAINQHFSLPSFSFLKFR